MCYVVKELETKMFDLTKQSHVLFDVEYLTAFIVYSVSIYIHMGATEARSLTRAPTTRSRHEQ